MIHETTRGGVEDTRLEAKDTKNFEAKDRPSQGQAQGRGHKRRFLQIEIENSPPPHRKTAPPQTFEFSKLAEKPVSISVKTFFFFGDHLLLGGKNL